GAYLWANLRHNVAYLLDPYAFFGALAIIGLAITVYNKNRRSAQRKLDSAQPHVITAAAEYIPLAVSALGLFCLYLLFYAGSFDLNPRYSIQLLAPMTVLAAALLRGPAAILLLSMVLPYTR